MGKKNKYGPQLRSGPLASTAATAAPVPAAAVTRLLATTVQTAPLLSEEAPVWEEAQVKELAQKLPPAEQQRFASFIERFASLGTQLKDAHERIKEERSKVLQDNEKAQAELGQERNLLNDEYQELQRQLSDAQAERQEQEATRRALEDKRVELETRHLALVQQEAGLLQREAELRGGLVTERERSLQVLRQQVAELEARRDRLPMEIDEQRRTLLEQARLDAELMHAKVRELDSELHQREVQLAAQRQEQERRERQLLLDEHLLKDRRDTLDKEAKEHAQRCLDNANAQLQRRQDRINKLYDQLVEKQQELDELQDLRDLAGGDPQQLVDELEQLRQRNRDLDCNVQELLASRSQDDSERLRHERDDLQEQLDAAEAELFELRRRESQWRRSVTEREDWETTRRVLESNRTLLQKAVVQLQGDVKDLVDRQQHEAVFPELTRMDRDLDKPVVTEPVSNDLTQLVDELQARIAHAEPGKVLSFRKEELQLFLGGLAMSQLHIFQGISGTGKTTLAVAFAEAVGGKLTRVPVQAGWRDRADVLGHYNAFEKRYYERETLQALYQAQTPAYQDLLHVVLLDEMNLSRPEQYFADFLSTMEVEPKKRWIRLLETAPAQAPAQLREGREILLPPNVWFIGTANQDETTNAFADKTHDRAFVLDLPKQEERGEKFSRPDVQAPWSFESLAKRFDAACKTHAAHTLTLVKHVNASGLTTVLNDRFGLGWGNRLERQMRRFVPVVMAAGGTDALALDHLLASRMFRDGKVTGRYDVKPDDLLEVKQALLSLWRDCRLEVDPRRCLQAIERDVQRLQRQG